MKKININSKGFTLIELLAVILILGILMMVAIPAVTRTIENSRRDTFADNAKEYINNIRNSVLADELKCGDVSVGATPDGAYYYIIDTQDQGTKDLMEQGGKSSWSNSDVSGYVAWIKKSSTSSGSSEQKVRTTYGILLVDSGKHGIDKFTLEDNIGRSAVSTATSIDYNSQKIDATGSKVKSFASSASSAQNVFVSDAKLSSANYPTSVTTPPVQCVLK